MFKASLQGKKCILYERMEANALSSDSPVPVVEQALTASIRAKKHFLVLKH